MVAGVGGLSRRAQGEPGYFGSKAAVEQFCRTLAKEIAPRGITVNVVSPGFTETAMLLANMEADARRDFIEMTPLHRLGQPEEIADVISVPGRRTRALDQPPEHRRRRRNNKPIAIAAWEPRPKPASDFWIHDALLSFAYDHLSRTARSDFSHCGIASSRSFVQFSLLFRGTLEGHRPFDQRSVPSTMGVTRPVP